MILIVGLGNPGPAYIGTRHNTGFLAADFLAERLGVPFVKAERFLSLIARSDDKKVIVAKPLTMMNLSGRAVQSIASFYKIPTENIWVIYDDVDLPIGTARVRGEGTGESSHNGVRSITSALGTAAFPRFRIGIAKTQATGDVGDRPHQSISLKEFVLEPFDKREVPMVEKAITWVVEELLAALQTGTVISRRLTKGV